MSFDPTAYLAETATLDTPAAPPSAPPPAAFDPSAYLADVGQLNLTDTRAGGPAYQGGPDGSQFSNISSEVADTFANAKQVAPMAIRIGAPMAGVAVGSALTAATGGLALPISMAIAGGSAALAEPFAQMAEKALGQRQDYSVAEGAINTAVAAIPGVPFKNLPLPSITTRAGQILARGAQGAATAAGQDVATRYVRGENDVLATAGNSALIGAGFGALIGTAFDEVARKVNLDKMFTTARNAGFTGETVDDLRRWWQAPDLNQYSLPQAQPTPAPTRPPVLDLEVMSPGGAPRAPGDPILPPGARPLALPPAAVPRDVLRLMPGPAPLALSAPAPEPTAPAPLPVAVDSVQAAPSGLNLPTQPSPAPSATVQNPPALPEAAGQPPAPLTATMPTTPVSRLAEEGGVPAAESPISGADQPIGRGSQVNVQFNDGRSVTGTYEEGGGMKWVTPNDGGDPIITTEAYWDLNGIKAVTAGAPKKQIKAPETPEIQTYAPTNRDEYETALWTLANQANNIQPDTHRGDFLSETRRKRAIDAEFNRIADQIELSRTKRRYIYAQAHRKINNLPLQHPIEFLEYEGPMEAQSFEAPKANDFSPDQSVRRSRSEKPSYAYLTKAQVEGSLTSARIALKGRLSDQRRGQLERILAERTKQLADGKYREAVQAKEQTFPAPTAADLTAPEQRSPATRGYIEPDPVNHGLYKTKTEATARLSTLVNTIEQSPQMVALLETYGLVPTQTYQVAKTNTGKWSIAKTHQHEIAFALSKQAPVSAAAVEAYKIKLPAGYVRKGEVYTYTQPDAVAPEPISETDDQREARIKAMPPMERTDADVQWANKRARARMEQKAKQVQATADAEKAKQNDVDGFTDSLPQIKAAKYREVLNTVALFNGIPLTRKEAIRQRVNEGWKVVTATSPKGFRRFTAPAGGFFIELDITKIGMDYAAYLEAKAAKTSAAPAADTAAARPHAKLTATALKAKIQSLEAGIAKPSQTATRRATLTTDLATYQAEASYRAAAKAAKGKSKGRGFAIPSLPDGSPDLINTLDELGGIRPRPRDYRGGEYDDLDLTKGVLRQLRRQTGRPVDKVLAELNEGYGYRFESPADLQAALDKALLTRARLQQVAGRDQATALFQAAALENKGRGNTASTAKVIAPEQITEGDTFAIKREPVTVAAIDPDTAAITLKDGERFGTQIVPAGVPIYADKGSYQPAPAGVAGLSWGEVVKTNDARIQAEAEAGAQDWEAVVAANQAEAEAAVQDLPAPVIDTVPAFSTVADMASDTGAAPQSSGSPQSGPDNAVAYLEGIHANGRNMDFSDLGLSIRDKSQVSGKLKDPNLYKKAKKVGEVGIFWRNGAPPESGRSFNFKDQRSEIGVSVYSEPYPTSFAGHADRPWYRIEGKIVGFGSDSEPLVEVISSKRITEKQREADISWHNAHKKHPVFLPGDVIEIPQYGDIYSDWGSQYVVIDIAKDDTGTVYGYNIAPDWTVDQSPPLRQGPSYVSFDEEMLGKHTIFSKPPATIREDLREKGFSILRTNLDKYLTRKTPNPARTAEGAPRPPSPAQPLVIRPKAQTLDMFDAGLTDMPFTMAGESVQDFTGNMDEVARQAAAKAEADAAQGGLFGAAAGYADWEAVRRIIDPQSVLPQRVRDAVRFGTQAITGHLVRAKDNQADLLRAMNRLRATLPGIATTVRAYLDGNIPLAALPVSVRVPAQAIRSHIDALSERAVREGVVTGTLARTLLDNQGKYLRRSYRIFDDTPGWIATRDFQVARRNWIAYLLTQPNPAAAGVLYTRDAAEILTNQLTDRENATSFMIGGRVAGRDVSSLIRRQDLPPELRALYGEILDPIEAYGQTIPRLARLVENHYAQQWIRLIGLNTGIFSTSATQLNHRPLVSPNNQPHEVWQGLYTQPVIARALEREATTSGRAFSAAESIFKLIRTFTGLSKLTKTVLNPDSYSPNFIGGIITTLANGNFNLLPLGRGFMLASEELGILRAAGILPQNRAQLKDDLEKLAKLGLRMEGLDSADLIRTWETSLLPMLNNRANRIITPVLGAYGQIDNITKYVSWKNEVARLKLWMPPLTPLATLERIAAERVRATTQVYGSIPKIITDLSRLGIAPSFVSFTWELFRNTANTARIAAQDFSEGARTGNRAQQWDGARRLASLLAVVGGGLGILALSRREHDITDQQDDAVRFFGPKYDENSTLHYNSPLKDGRVNVSNASYLLPHMLLTEAVMAGYRGDTGEEQTQRFLNQLTKQFLAADGGVFIGPLAETFVGYNRDTGLPVFNRQSPTPGLDAMGYLGDRTLTPLILRKVENYVKAARGEIGPNGKVFSAADENWRLVGARQQTRDLDILAGYKARDLSRQWVDASRLYTALQGRNVPAADLEAGYQRAATARQAVAAQVKEYFRLGLTPGTGLTEDDLIKNLRSGQGLSAEELLGIIDGKYVDQPRDRSQSAVQVLDRVKRMPEDKRMAAVAAEIIKDPALVKGITREIKTLAKGITQADRLVLSLDIADGSRARYLAIQITTQRVSPEAVPAYLAEAKAKGILTDAVYQQLKTGSWRDLDQ